MEKSLTELEPPEKMGILIDENTLVVVQGITRREGKVITKASLDWGTKIVSGVTPERGGQAEFGIPVYGCLKSVLVDHKPNATVICVPR